MNHRQLVLDENSEFQFHCHDGLECFKQCCRDINIYLTPYDVLRMKNSLGLPSGEFLERYTLNVQAPHTGFTFVQIKMSEEDNLKCPFITGKGCQVYQERPWSCRIAPVDMLGAGKYSFIFESSRCHGLNEPKVQTIKEWIKDQGLEIYDEMEEGFNEISEHLKLSGDKVRDQKIGKLFFLACYDLDKFRSLLMKNPYVFEKMHLSQELIAEIRQDDVKLMKFGFKLLSSGAGSLNDLSLEE